MAKTDTPPNVVYRGQIIRVQVPHYHRSIVQNGSSLRPSMPSHGGTDELERRKFLLESRHRYHSEPDLLDAASAEDESMLLTPRHSQRKVTDENVPRTVVLRKNGGTFGFLLCGTTSNTGGLHGVFRPTVDHPASQYFDSVQRGSVAANAGLKTGDFLLEINGENVVMATHGHTVQLIRSSGDAICLKIITPPRRGISRPRVAAHNWQQEVTVSSSGPSNDRTHVSSTSSCIAGNNTALTHLSPAQLPTTRSMPDLTAALDNAADQSTHQHQNNDERTVMVDDDDVQGSSQAVYRNRVLYELTNQLRPSTVVMQPPLKASSSEQRNHDRRTSERPHAKSVDQTISPQRRPAPPPRGMSLSSRIQPAVSALTASRAKSTGCEFKELLAVSGHQGTSLSTEQQHISTPSPAERSVISGEHLVLPSQLKILHRSPTNQSSQHAKTEDNCTTPSYNGATSHQSSVSAHPGTSVEHRSPIPKRPAPPPPSTNNLTTPPTANGEVNFLVMAEQARKQYILSKLAKATLAVSKATDQSTAGNHKTDAKQHDEGLQKTVSGSANLILTNGESRFKADGINRSSSNELQTQMTSSARTEGSLPVGKTVERTDASLASSSQQLGDLPPAIPPKRRPRNRQTADVEQHTTYNVNATEYSHSSAANVSKEAVHSQDSSEHGRPRKSNARLIRGKNVAVRRSGISRQSVTDAVNGEHHRSQLTAVYDNDVLPPPPDFAD